MVDISTAVGIVSVPKRWALEASRRELSVDVSFGMGTLLVVGAIELGQPPQGDVMYTVCRIRYEPPWNFTHFWGGQTTWK